MGLFDFSKSKKANKSPEVYDSKISNCLPRKQNIFKRKFATNKRAPVNMITICMNFWLQKQKICRSSTVFQNSVSLAPEK